MANKDLKLRPHRIRGRDDVWWYEDPKGIDICYKRNHFVVPWRAIRSALARKDSHTTKKAK